MANLKPAFSTDLGSVYNVDCMKLLATVGDDQIDTVFADPPFNLAKDYGNGKDKDDLENGDYLSLCYGWMDECIRVLKPGGSMFIYSILQPILNRGAWRFVIG